VIYLAAFLALAADATPVSAAPPAAAQLQPIVTTRSGLRIETLAPGAGPRPKKEDAVRVRYEVRLADGTLIDAPAEPSGLRVAGVIDGLTEALLLMNKGGRYRIWIPAKLAYGKQGNADGSVPPDADLVFTVELLAIGRVARAPASR